MLICCRRTWTITCRSGTPASRHPGSCTIRLVSTNQHLFVKHRIKQSHMQIQQVSNSPTLFPSPDFKLSLFLSLPVYPRSSLLTWEGRGWVRRIRIIRLRESLTLYKSFDTLWVQLLIPLSQARFTWPSMNNLILSGCIPLLIRSHLQLTFIRYLSKPSPPSQHRLHNYLPYLSLSLSPLCFILCSKYRKNEQVVLYLGGYV